MMRRVQGFLSKIVIAVFLVTTLLALGYGEKIVQAAPGREDLREKTEILVKYRDQSRSETIKGSIKNKLRVSRLESKRTFSRQKAELLEINEKDNIDTVIAELRKDPNVEYAQPNYKLEIETVNDPRFAEQWALKNTAQDVEGQAGRNGVDINIEPAWEITRGSPSVVVGVLDTGIDINHNDLKDNIYVNVAEKNGIPGVDDDGNGYIDDVNGWDFVNGDASVYDSASLDLHGTYIAGIIAAKADNNEGITGVAPNVKVLPLKFIHKDVGYTCDAIAAIDYAMEMGVKIINCSFGGRDNNYFLKDAMQNSGILFVTAAGNRGMDVAVQPVYPPSFDIPNVLSVAAIDNQGMLAPFSSYGDKIHVAAPGIGLLSTTPDNTYDYLSGTSVSAPVVTGIAALLKSKEPGLSYMDIAARIKNNVVVSASLQGKISTGGRVDARAVLTNIPPAPDNTPPSGGGSNPGGNQGGQDDSWYSEDQLSHIREQNHYGESGVNPATGNYSITGTDMSVPAPGFRIDISRTYNSKDGKSSPLGQGWTFGFEGYIYGSGSVTARLPNGSVQLFRKEGETYVAEDSRSVLVKNADNSYLLTTKDQYKYTFNSDGYLSKMEDRNGNVVAITLDSAVKGRVNSITDPVGRNYTVTYNARGLIEKITDPMNREVKYEYDPSKALLLKVTDPEGKTMNYVYDQYGFIKEVKDHNLKIIETLVYDHSAGDNQHKVSQATDAFGDRCDYVYDNVERKTAITENNTRRHVYWYDTSYYTTKVQDPEGKFTVTEYEPTGGKNKYGEVKSTTDRNGNTTYYQRDGRGNITRITNPDTSYREYAYDDLNNLTMEKDEEGKCTFYDYGPDKKNLLIRAQSLNGTDTPYIPGTNDGDFAITAYTYDARGLVKTVADPEGNTSEYTYDAFGNVETVKDPENNTTTNQYNTVGWLLETTTPRGFKTTYTYDQNGLLEKQVLQGGETTRITYDAMGRKTQEISPKQYNPAHDGLATHTYSGDYGTRYTYYDNGKIKTITDGENNTTSYTYNVYGFAESETKPNGAVYTYEYDNMDRLAKVSFKENTGANPVVLEEYSYAILADFKTQKTQTKYLNATDKAVTVSTYDYANRLVEQQQADGAVLKTEYNLNGTVKTTTDGNGSITYYTYDGLNRLAKRWSPADTVNGSTVYSYAKTDYDRAGQKVSEMAGKELVPLWDTPQTFAAKNYEYYKNGKVKTVTDNEGRKTFYAYDADGYLSREEAYTDAQYRNVTEYTANYFGKPTEKKVHIRLGDLDGNSPEDSTDYILATLYTYDKNGNLETVQTPDGVTTTYTYDSMNRQTGISQPGKDELEADVAITTSTQYNWEGKPSDTTDANGNHTSYTYTKRGFLEKTTDALQGVTQYYYDLGGRKIAEVSPKNYDSSKGISELSRTEYTYDTMDRILTKVYKYKDSNNTWVTITAKAYKYDFNGNVLKEQDALGVDENYGTEYIYNLANKIKTVTDPVSRERALPYTTRYEYDGLLRKVSETNAKGVITNYEYDNTGNILSVKIKKRADAFSEDRIQSATYDLLGNMLTQTDANGNITTFEYNALGKVRKMTTPGDETVPSNTLIYQYDPMGRILTQKDSLDTFDTYTYDNQGRNTSHIQKTQDGQGQDIQVITTSIRYDKNGNKRFETDGNGTVQENTYDGLNRLTSTKVTVSGVLHETTYGYDANGNQTIQKDWLNNEYANVYDPLNRLIEKRDPYYSATGKAIQRLEYNKNSAQERSYDALGNMTQYRYDKNSRLIETIDPGGHKTGQSYDNVGNIQTKTDGRNISTTYSYDELNRLVSVTNALSEKTSYTYDLNGNRLTQTDGKGNTTSFEYNVANKLVKRIDPGGRIGSPGNYTYYPEKVEGYTYDVHGNLKTKTDRNGVNTVYAYDSHDRMVGQQAGELSISYTYDNNGNQLDMTDGTGTTTRTYDELNRALTKEVPGIGQTAFAYDQTDGVSEGCWLETATDPKGNVTRKVYDKAGRLSSVMDGESQPTVYEYYENGSRKSVTYPDGAKEEYTYFKDGLLQTLVNKKADGSILDSYTYAYDGAHNQTKKTDSKGDTNYTYDSLNRLLSVTEPGGKVIGYNYDKAGNRTFESVQEGMDITSTTYSYNEQNRLMSTITTLGGTTEKVTYTYDDNGNMVSESKTVIRPADPDVQGAFNIYRAGTVENTDITLYTYDVWNQLTQTIIGDKTVTYAYNGEGYRVSKNINGQVTRYLYEYDKVVLEVDGQGNQTARNVYGTNLLARTAGSDTYFYMYNGHADVTALLNFATGDIMGTYYYDAFGNITEQTGSVNNSITYAGYQYDEETKNYYLNARYYDPKIARFLSEDTYTGDPNDPLSLNLYTYCQNEPLKYSDPTGHFLSPIDIITIGIGIGIIADIIKDTINSGSGGSSGSSDSSGGSSGRREGSSGDNSRNNKESFSSAIQNIVSSILNPYSLLPVSPTPGTIKSTSFIPYDGTRIVIFSRDMNFIYDANKGIMKLRWSDDSGDFPESYRGKNKPITVDLPSQLYNKENDGNLSNYSQVALALTSTQWYNAKNEEERKTALNNLIVLRNGISEHSFRDNVVEFLQWEAENIMGDSILGQLLSQSYSLEKATGEAGQAKANYIYAALSVSNTNQVMLNPNDINFSQRSAGGNGRYGPLYESMAQNGWNGPPIDAVKTSEGFTTIDNTRVAVARELGIKDIPVNVRTESDLLPKDMVGRFGSAKTWGEALKFRIGSQKPPLPFEGTPKMPRLPKK